MKHFGSHTLTAIDDFFPSEKEVDQGDHVKNGMGDVFVAQENPVPRQAPRNPSGTSTLAATAVLPVHEELQRGVAMGFILGVSFFLVVRYVKRRFL